MASGVTKRHNVEGYNFEYNSLVTMKLDGQEEIIQYVSNHNDGIKFNFDFKGNNVKLQVYEEKQYKYKHYMPEPKFIDSAKVI